MLSVKSTTLRNQLITCSLLLVIRAGAFAQDNSPYSRYGLGDLHPYSNIFNRGMGGISAAYSDYLSVNFSNPASYSRFVSYQEARSKKSASGRMVLDVGLNFDNRTLKENNNPEKFTSPNAYFSYLQLGLPLRKNLGMVIGLRPISKINYKVERRERLFDPGTGLPIDSALTEFSGDGGAFLVNSGLGYGIKNFSIGFNAGYMFGKKDYSTRRFLYNDSLIDYYKASNHQTRNTFGDLFFNLGMQYRVYMKKDSSKYFQAGIFGNLKHTLNGRRDIIRETFVRAGDGGDFRLDSVQEQLDIKGTVEYPAGFGGGFLIEQFADRSKAGWLLGVDFTTTNWSSYRFFNQADALANSWQLKIGGQLKPAIKEVKYKYLMAYRAGVFFGKDYVYLGQKLPEFGITGGVTLPVGVKTRGYRTQSTIVNISAEYIKRGNKSNLLREDMFRLSLGFSLGDQWFTKRKYE